MQQKSLAMEMTSDQGNAYLAINVYCITVALHLKVNLKVSYGNLNTKGRLDSCLPKQQLY